MIHINTHSAHQMDGCLFQSQNIISKTILSWGLESRMKNYSVIYTQILHYKQPLQLLPEWICVSFEYAKENPERFCGMDSRNENGSLIYNLKQEQVWNLKTKIVKNVVIQHSTLGYKISTAVGNLLVYLGSDNKINE